MPFVKLDAGILRSTIWYKRPALEVFLTALLMAEPWEFAEPVPTIKVDSLDADDFVIPAGWYGFVRASGPGIVHQSGINDDQAGMQALRELSQPEGESRSQQFDGRRMVRVDGGYIVLNFMRYRDYDHEAAERMRRLRARRKIEGVRANGDAVRANVTYSREQKAEAESNKTLGAGAPPTSDSDWISELSKNAAYEGIDVRREFGKMVAWTTTNKKQPTKRRFVNWLNRAERPISLNGHAAPQKPALNEPKGWKAWLNHNRPDSVYSVGGNSECHEWAKLPREAQEVVLAGLR